MCDDGGEKKHVSEALSIVQQMPRRMWLKEHLFQGTVEFCNWNKFFENSTYS